MPGTTNLVTVTNLTVRRGGQIVLQNLDYTLQEGQCWALVGPIGSGKTTFLQALAGQLPVSPAMISRQRSVTFVSFKEESGQFSYSGHFYQQRYHATSSDSHNGKPALTLREYLRFSETPATLNLIRRLGLEPLLDTAFIKLSNGQTRKARIGKALLQHPEILLLDNPFVGLDALFRADLNKWLEDLIAHGLTLVLIVEPDNLPDFVTDVLVLEKGRSVWSGAKANFVVEQPRIDELPVPVRQTAPKPADFAEAFRLTEVSVRYGDRVILDTINWTVRAGEHWALIGPNGAGKSVLLSLLYGDHPQAYANDVRVFGHRRGKGESIWDVKRRIGFVSPELHLYFPQHLTVEQVILTGLTDTLTVPTRVAISSAADLQLLVDYFGLSANLNRSFGMLSVGEQRLTLLIRALIKNPPVLILDEPFQALDTVSIGLAQRLLETLSETTVLFVTHNRRELPQRITQVFDLAQN